MQEEKESEKVHLERKKRFRLMRHREREREREKVKIKQWKWKAGPVAKTKVQLKCYSSPKVAQGCYLRPLVWLKLSFDAASDAEKSIPGGTSEVIFTLSLERSQGEAGFSSTFLSLSLFLSPLLLCSSLSLSFFAFWWESNWLQPVLTLSSDSGVCVCVEVSECV